jgi:hypothetical protein
VEGALAFSPGAFGYPFDMLDQAYPRYTLRKNMFAQADAQSLVDTRARALLFAYQGRSVVGARFGKANRGGIGRD